MPTPLFLTTLFHIINDSISFRFNCMCCSIMGLSLTNNLRLVKIGSFPLLSTLASYILRFTPSIFSTFIFVCPILSPWLIPQLCFVYI